MDETKTERTPAALLDAVSQAARSAVRDFRNAISGGEPALGIHRGVAFELFAVERKLEAITDAARDGLPEAAND